MASAICRLLAIPCILLALLLVGAPETAPAINVITQSAQAARGRDHTKDGAGAIADLDCRHLTCLSRSYRSAIARGQTAQSRATTSHVVQATRRAMTKIRIGGVNVMTPARTSGKASAAIQVPTGGAD